MKPANLLLRAEVERIVDLKIQTGSKRARLKYAELAAACNVKRNTLARAVCVELRRRKSEINQIHVEQPQEPQS
jgi:hypothetical protein